MKKKFTVLLSAVMVIVLVTAGTFAWVNFSQNIINEFQGDGSGGGGETNPGGTTHDDFDDETGQKEVYVENWGESVIYVRVRLDEYMEIGKGAGLKGDFLEGSTTVIVPNVNNQSVPLIPGAKIDDSKTWRPHAPEEQVELCEVPPEFHSYWKWTMGGSKIYRPVSETDRINAGYIDQNTTVYTDINAEAGLKETLNSTVITMAKWIADGQNIGSYWVVDTDGWAYWAAPLNPGDATGLLLKSVVKIADIEDSYYYAINVLAQMATKTGDLNYKNFYDESDDNNYATDDGKDLLDIITGGTGGGGKTVPATNISINGGDKTIAVGESYTPSIVITPANSTDTPVWSSSNPDVASVDPVTGRILGVSVGTAEITVTAGGVSDSITVTVTAATLPEIPTIDGEGPYDTEYNDDTNLQHLNYALKCKNIKGTIYPEPDLDQNGSIKLSSIIAGSDYTGIGVRASNAEYDGYFTVGTDKDGSPAIIYTYIPDVSVWIAAIDTTGTPVIENVELMLTKDGCQDTRILVTLRYSGSYFINE